MTEPEPEQDTEYEGSHFTPDIICPFCHQNVKKHGLEFTDGHTRTTVRDGLMSWMDTLKTKA